MLKVTISNSLIASIAGSATDLAITANALFKNHPKYEALIRRDAKRIAKWDKNRTEDQIFQDLINDAQKDPELSAKGAWFFGKVLDRTTKVLTVKSVDNAVEVTVNEEAITDVVNLYCNAFKRLIPASLDAFHTIVSLEESFDALEEKWKEDVVVDVPSISKDSDASLSRIIYGNALEHGTTTRYKSHDGRNYDLYPKYNVTLDNGSVLALSDDEVFAILCTNDLQHAEKNGVKPEHMEIVNLVRRVFSLAIAKPLAQA